MASLTSRIHGVSSLALRKIADIKAVLERGKELEGLDSGVIVFDNAERIGTFKVSKQPAGKNVFDTLGVAYAPGRYAVYSHACNVFPKSHRWIVGNKAYLIEACKVWDAYSVCICEEQAL